MATFLDYWKRFKKNDTLSRYITLPLIGSFGLFVWKHFNFSLSPPSLLNTYF